jgi:DNA helicase-2/ATP-dependent DNA helicase PcrA
MNAQSNQLEYAFKRSGVPYRIIGGTRFFDRAEVKDMLAYLCVIQAPEDDLRVQRIINNPPRGIGAKSVETAMSIAAEEHMPLLQVCAKAEDYPALQRAAYRLRQFAALIDELRAASLLMPPDELYDQVIERTGYIKALEEKNTQENTARIENVQELKTNIVNYLKEEPEGNLAGFLDEVALYTDIDNYDREADCVTMMTMHAAKGLEFPTVFVVGCEEGIFPGLRAIGEPGEMEEERRLCYVALTRAKKRLYLTCARQRMLFGRTTANRISRFVEEIPEDDIVKRGVTRGYSYSEPTAQQREYQQFVERRPQKTHFVSAPARTASRPAAKPDFALGDHVQHRAFGSGVITKVSPMGGDALLEIQFESAGLKRLMLRAAGQFMKKETP